MTAPNRRWFRFSLATMFVLVTVCCVLLGWLAWNREKVRDRERLIQSLLKYPQSRRPDRLHLWIHRPFLSQPPWLWRLMGATNMYSDMLLEVDTSDKVSDDIQALLPDYELMAKPHRRAAEEDWKNVAR
jgi:hypothetical protein